MRSGPAPDSPPGRLPSEPHANRGPRRRLPDRDQPHFQKKKMVVLVVVGVLILLALALLIHSGGLAIMAAARIWIAFVENV